MTLVHLIFLSKTVFSPLDAILAVNLVFNYRKMGGLSSSGQFWKALDLISLLRTYKPDSILEFGSGLSTFVFMNYMANHGCELTVVEEDINWINKIKERTKNQNFAVGSEVSWCLAEREISENWVDYDYAQSTAVDLIFIDGPSLIINGKSQKHMVCKQASRLAHLANRILVISGRKKTVEALELENRFHCFKSTFGSLRLRNQYFSFFIPIDT